MQIYNSIFYTKVRNPSKRYYTCVYARNNTSQISAPVICILLNSLSHSSLRTQSETDTVSPSARATHLHTYTSVCIPKESTPHVIYSRFNQFQVIFTFFLFFFLLCRVTLDDRSYFIRRERKNSYPLQSHRAVL